MPHDTLFAARLEAKAVVPPSGSSGSGTGVFLLSSRDGGSVLSFQVTYAGLSSPVVRSITLRNFGAGRNGEVVHVICGVARVSCPSGRENLIRGEWTEAEGQPSLTPKMLTELANRRIYLEIETDSGREVRAQLATSPFMVKATEAQVELRGAGATEGARGTGVVRLVRFPNHVQLGVLLTVAGARDKPTAVAFEGRSDRFRELKVKAPAGAEASQTLRLLSTSAEIRSLSDPALAEALTNGELTLVVFLGNAEQDTVRGKLIPVR